MDIPRESQYEECKLPEGSNFMAFTWAKRYRVLAEVIYRIIRKVTRFHPPTSWIHLEIYSTIKSAREEIARKIFRIIVAAK